MTPKTQALEIKNGKVLCPDSGDLIDYMECRKCLFMRNSNATRSSSDSGDIEGIVVCEIVPIERG
jgi:hypothetical protein